jgi:hypothetical protein
VLLRVDPQQLDDVLARWNAAYAAQDEALAIDGKTLRNAIDRDARRCHVLSVVGHQSGTASPKKLNRNIRLVFDTRA